MAESPPRVGFVSLGCPKALVDSERILTELRAEGYAIAPTYRAADLVIVNTCGFIDSAIDESLDAIGEAVRENGKVIVTGCLGARAALVRARHPGVLAVTGPHATDEVMSAVRRHLPHPHDPLTSLVPPHGVRLTYSEGQGSWVLLAPERVFKADQIAVEIIKRCTGEATFGEIVDDLAKTFTTAPREKILADVSALLRGLADKKLLEL